MVAVLVSSDRSCARQFGLVAMLLLDLLLRVAKRSLDCSDGLSVQVHIAEQALAQGLLGKVRHLLALVSMAIEDANETFCATFAARGAKCVLVFIALAEIRHTPCSD